MKNIFSKLGYISRAALIGTVLGVATVAVGIGIVTNFTGSSSNGPQGFSGAALEQYAGDVSSGANSTGYSKEDLQAGMAAAEMDRNTNSVSSLRNAASKESFAYGNKGGPEAVNPNIDGSSAYAGVDGGEAAAGGALDSIGSTGQGISAIDAGAVAPNEAAAMAAAQAANAAKAGEMQASSQRTGAQLQTSKMMTGSSVGKGGSGGSSSGGSYRLPSAGDKPSASAIPQGMAGNLPSGPVVDAFKGGGRAGSIGGFNVKAQGAGQNGSGQAYFSTTVAELANAAKYSQGGKKTVYGDASKGAALAGAAFDGSETAAEGVQIDGANVTQSAATELERTANTLQMQPKHGTSSLDPVDYDITTGKDIKKNIWKKVIGALIATLAGCVAISVAVTAGGIWGWIVAAILLAATLAAIWATGLPGLLSDLGKLKYSGGMNATWTKAIVYTLLAVFTGAAVACMVPAVGKAICKMLGIGVAKGAGGTFKGLLGAFGIGGKGAATAAAGAALGGLGNVGGGGGSEFVDSPIETPPNNVDPTKPPPENLA